MSEVKESIIQAATEAMIVKSYNSVGLNEILKPIGVPKGSFYHYFASKEELGVSVICHACSTHAERLKERFADESKTPLQRLKVSYEESRDHSISIEFQNKCLVSKLALEVGCLSDSMRKAIHEGMNKWKELTVQLLIEAKAENEIGKNVDPEAMAEFLISSWEGVTLRSQASKSPAPMNDFISITFGELLKTCG